MTWLHKQLRPLLFVLGGLLVIGSLLGARLLTAGGGGGTDATPAPPGSKTALGTIVQGNVDSDPPPVYTGLPPVLQSGEVVQVFVKAGDEVKVRPVTIFGHRVELGDRLYKFNTRMLDAKLAEAEEAVAVARANVSKAKALQDQQQSSINVQKQKLDVAKSKVELTEQALKIYETNLWDSLLKTQTPEKAKQLFENDPERFKKKTDYLIAVQERNGEQVALTELEKTVTVKATVAVAEAEVKRTEAMLDEAKTAVDLCTVRAKVNGTVEQVNVSAGTVIGVSTRTPAVVLVPSGRRVVRAEVEAEFAHRIGTDKIGKKVTIYDNTDPKLTYEGTVERIGDTFLPKRGAGDGLIQSDTRVLEALVVVSDPAPAGKPPLRVGQKVRVNFGQ